MADKTSALRLAVLYGAVLVSAAVVSMPMLVLVAYVFLGAAAITALSSRSPELGTYALTLPLALLTLWSVMEVLIGWIPALAVAAVALVGCGLAAIRMPRRYAFTWGALASPATPLVLLIPLASIGVFKRVSPGADFGWLMSGDSLSELYWMTSLRASGPGHDAWAVIASTSAHDYLANTLAYVAGGTASPTLVMDMRAFAAVVVLSLALGTLQYLVGLGSPERGRTGLIQGAVFGLLVISGALIGLPASNGFINVGLSFAMYAIAMTAAARLSCGVSRLDLAAAVASILVLTLVWPPVAMTAAGLVLASVLSKRDARRLLTLAVILPGAIITGYWIVTSIVPGVPKMPITTGVNYYYFPITPVAAFALASAMLFISERRVPHGAIVRAVPAAAIGGAIGMFIAVGGGDPMGILADSHVLSATRYYTFLKFVWQVCMPLLVLVAVVLFRPKMRERIGVANTTAALGAVLVAAFTFANMPNVPWLPLDSRGPQQELAQFALMSRAERSHSDLALQGGVPAGWIDFCNASSRPPEYC